MDITGDKKYVNEIATQWPKMCSIFDDMICYDEKCPDKYSQTIQHTNTFILHYTGQTSTKKQDSK